MRYVSKEQVGQVYKDLHAFAVLEMYPDKYQKWIGIGVVLVPYCDLCAVTVVLSLLTSKNCQTDQIGKLSVFLNKFPVQQVESTQLNKLVCRLKSPQHFPNC